MDTKKNRKRESSTNLSLFAFSKGTSKPNAPKENETVVLEHKKPEYPLIQKYASIVQDYPILQKDSETF